MLKRTLYFLGIALFVGSVMTGCSGGGAGGSDTYPLAGTWTISTASTSGASIGTGSITLSYLGEVFFDIYIGSGTLSGGSFNGSYSAGGTEYSGIASFTLSVDGVDADGDTYDDAINFSGTLSGTTVTGTYDGDAGTAYDGLAGTFTATKN